MGKKVSLLKPLLPSLDEFIPSLHEIWGNQWLTNDGDFHNRLEEELKSFLGVPNLLLMTNGTLPIMTALHALKVRGEVITTPYSFVGTTHAITWQGLKPVFADVEATTGCIDPQRIEDAITPQTEAILAVHIYGQPCDIENIRDIASRHELKVIYDAAHAFGVKKDGKSILNEGDVSTLSFHATKVFNTAEGGALITKDSEICDIVRNLRNFGIESETEVACPGINSKMDELRSALGLANLRHVEETIAARSEVHTLYRNQLADIEGIDLLPIYHDISYNYGYFPIRINEILFGRSRDEVYDELKEKGITTRRYFYPLISNLPFYSGIPSADASNLPEANRWSETVLCLPCHHLLSEEDVYSVSEALKEAKR
ncbi:MAG: DegT/DnrJ/EryC1/StrS family aminotransferase [Muribaculaceae bacterium]|nr:DegT/DnrJ/EryC1/StrS family aminotransferase [Muribaculaceae bacterium]